MIVSSRRLLFIGLPLLALGLFFAGNSAATLREVAGSYRAFVTVFLGIFIEALPFLLLGTLASGLVEEFVSREALSRLSLRNRLGNVLLGALMGLAFPVCECGVVPLTRRLFRKGLPLPAGVAFLLAAPVINPVVIASTFAAFGWGAVFVGRIFFTLLIAMGVGLVFSLAPQPARLLQPDTWLAMPGNAHPACQPVKAVPVGATLSGEVTVRPSVPVRLTRSLALAADEFFEMGRYLVLGSLLAASMQTVVPQSALLTIGGGALSSVVAMLTLAFVLSVCSTVDAFLALAFVNTFTSGSILGFLVFGPMVDVKSVLMFVSVFRRRVALYLVLLPLLMALLMAVYLNLNLG
jgi:uncharacterized membrane protein YraQ (UPF0718 family)